MAYNLGDSFVKTVKFKENPEIEDLIKQLNLIYDKIDFIYSKAKNLSITIEEKLLSKITISEASFEISVPSIIAKPTSDFDNAGASFVPSPVTATTLPSALSPKTKAYLCKG